MSSTSKSSLSFPQYFTALAKTYPRQTGNSTRSLFDLSWDAINKIRPITTSSRVHDNAAGPGTATSVLVERLAPDSLPSQILITDSVPAMVEAAKGLFESLGQSVVVQQEDALDLKTIGDGQISHSILNFSIFTLADPLQALREIHRTLMPGGVAVLSTWKRFGAGNVIHAAQALVRPDLPPMKVPRPEFFQEGVLSQMVSEAGFAADNVTVLVKAIVVKEEDLEGLRDFILGDFTKPARNAWTEQEIAKWPMAVEQAIDAETKEHGGVKFEAWIVLATR